METKTCEWHGTMQHGFRCLGDGRKAILRETPRHVTPFGGLVVLVGYWRELRLLEAARNLPPFRYRSPNAIGWPRFCWPSA